MVNFALDMVWKFMDLIRFVLFEVVYIGGTFIIGISVILGEKYGIRLLVTAWILWIFLEVSL